MTAFDEAYARYLVSLAKLDKTDDISEKNLLFRQLTAQLSDMEQKLQNQFNVLRNEVPEEDDAEISYWI